MLFSYSYSVLYYRSEIVGGYNLICIIASNTTNIFQGSGFYPWILIQTQPMKTRDPDPHKDTSELNIRLGKLEVISV